jgi:hypothetical protein
MSANPVRDDTRYDSQLSPEHLLGVHQRLASRGLGVRANAVCDDTRYVSEPLATCPVCGTKFQPVGRGRFCKPRCRQTAYRLRHRQVDTATLTDVTDQLRREHRLIAQTVYECSSCQQRLLGERRCSSCNLWCRKVGIGGECSGCDEIVTISELLGIKLIGGDAVA